MYRGETPAQCSARGPHRDRQMWQLTITHLKSLKSKFELQVLQLRRGGGLVHTKAEWRITYADTLYVRCSQLRDLRCGALAVRREACLCSDFLSRRRHAAKECGCTQLLGIRFPAHQLRSSRVERCITFWHILPRCSESRSPFVWRLSGIGARRRLTVLMRRRC